MKAELSAGADWWIRGGPFDGLDLLATVPESVETRRSGAELLAGVGDVFGFFAAVLWARTVKSSSSEDSPEDDEDDYEKELFYLVRFLYYWLLIVSSTLSLKEPN